MDQGLILEGHHILYSCSDYMPSPPWFFVYDWKDSHESRKELLYQNHMLQLLQSIDHDLGIQRPVSTALTCLLPSRAFSRFQA